MIDRMPYAAAHTPMIPEETQAPSSAVMEKRLFASSAPL